MLVGREVVRVLALSAARRVVAKYIPVYLSFQGVDWNFELFCRFFYFLSYFFFFWFFVLRLFSGEEEEKRRGCYTMLEAALWLFGSFVLESARDGGFPVWGVNRGIMCPLLRIRHGWARGREQWDSGRDFWRRGSREWTVDGFVGWGVGVGYFGRREGILKL